jgi:hypothetical protein
MASSDLPLKLPDTATDADRLLAHFSDVSGSSRLDPRMEQMARRVEFAFEQLRAHYQDADIARLIQNQFKVSRSTAYSDISTAKHIFGKLSPANLEFETIYLLSVAKKNIKWAVEGRSVKELTRAIEAYSKVLAMIREEEKIPWDKLQPNNYYMLINAPGGAVRLDLSNAHRMPASEINTIMQQLGDHFDEQSIKILEENDRDSGNPTPEAEPPADGEHHSAGEH